MHPVHELCLYLQQHTGTVVTQSAICRFLQSNNISRKVLLSIARERDEELCWQYMSDCLIYEPEMLVFRDETGCDKRSVKRKFGYALRGTIIVYAPYTYV